MKSNDRVYPDVEQDERYGLVTKGGLKVRDHIAVEAMKGMLSAYIDGNWKAVAKSAYEMADAMIEESEKY